MDASARPLRHPIDRGWRWVSPLTRLFAWLLHALYAVIPNYGVAIILLTILVRAVTAPLTMRQMRSMERLRRVQPRMKEIQEKYADDRQKQSEELMKLYRQEKVNPLGGCFPMLLQLPVFIGLYYALRSSLELRHAPFFGWINDLSAPDLLFTMPGRELAGARAADRDGRDDVLPAEDHADADARSDAGPHDDDRDADHDDGALLPISVGARALLDAEQRARDPAPALDRTSHGSAESSRSAVGGVVNLTARRRAKSERANMYEPRNEAHEFVGDDRAEAVRKAVAFFGLEEEGLVVRALDGATVYGLGGRTVVVAAPKNRAPVRRSEGGSSGERDRDRDRDRGRREGRREGRRDEGRRGNGRRDEGRRESAPPMERGFEPAPQAPEIPRGEPSVGRPKGTLSEIGEFVRGTIERLDLGGFEIGESEDEEVRAFEVTGTAARALAGGDGRAVDALALIVNQAAQKGDEDAKKVVLDVEGNTEAREGFLTRLAQRAVARAREAGRAIALDPMNGRDRRIIHLAVREEEGVASMSMGEGRYRQVVVVPEGAPEYDEARRQSEAAGQRD